MTEKKSGIGFFEKYLSVWVAACIGIGVVLGSLFPGMFQVLTQIEVAGINLPIAILVWAMIFPMMVQIDFASMSQSMKFKKGLFLTLFINWVLKPLSMAFFAWIFFKYLYTAFLSPEQAQEYIAGAILLGAAPCTAMVFVWSFLTKGNANYTLVQVAVNDIVLLLLFVPIVSLLIGVSDIQIPYDTLFYSVVLFVLLPLLAGFFANKFFIKQKGREWFQEAFLPSLKPFSILALLLTLVLIFAYQGPQILSNPWNIFLIAIPLTIQTYFIFFTTWFMGRKLKLSKDIAGPSALIGASNFFELAVVVAILLFGIHSGAVLATVVGVLIEVPVMLSLVWWVNKQKG